MDYGKLKLKHNNIGDGSSIPFLFGIERMNDLKSLKALLAGLFLVGCTNNSIQYQTIDAKKAKEMMATQDVVIVDVREESEYQAGHIPGAC